MADRLNKYPLVMVVWTDAIGKTGNWHTVESIEGWAEEQCWVARDVGYLVKKTKTEIILASSYAEKQEQFGMLRVIPAGWGKIIRLKEPKV
jgi:hypothetical protein